MLAVDSILLGHNIDVGRVIAEQIFTCKNKEVGNLFFPCLNTKLCAKAEVKFTEERKFPPGAISANYKERTKVQRDAAGIALQEQFMQQQRAMWKFEKDKLTWQDMWFQHLANGHYNPPKPIFPEWVLKIEKEKEEGEEVVTKKKEAKVVKKKPPTIKEKGKKKMVEEEPVLSSEELEDTTEEEEAAKAVKDLEKEDEEDSEEIESEEVEEIVVELVPKIKKGAPSKPFGPNEPPITPPHSKSPTISPIQSPSHMPKSPFHQASPQKEPTPPQEQTK